MEIPVRSDWKRLFCTLMHWPQADVIGRVDTSSAIIVIRHGAATLVSIPRQSRGL